MNKYIKEVIFENKQELYEDLTKLSESIKKITLKKKPFLLNLQEQQEVGKQQQ